MYKTITLAVFLLSFLTKLVAGEIREVRQLDGFDKIIAAQGINVILIEEDKEQALIRIENASPSDVITLVKGSTLKVRMKTKVLKDVSVVVEVSYKQLKSIEANTGATVEMRHQIFGDNIDIIAITAGKVLAKSETKSIYVKSGQGSVVELDGVCDKLKCSVNTGGLIKATNMTAKNVSAKVLGGGRCELYVTESIDANVTAGGKIIYKGDPKSESIKTSLGGTVEKKSYKHRFGEDLIKDKE